MHSLLIVVPLLVALAAGEARADAAAGEKKAQPCFACHGPEGNSTVPQYPVLAGQTFRYIYLQLKDFKEGRRKDPTMSPQAQPLSTEDITDLAEYFSKQEPKPIAFKPDPERVKRGEKKANETLCTMCHLGGFSGQNENPRVAGQWPDYVIKQLEDFKARRRTNDAGSMTSVAQTLSDRDIVDLAHYIGSLGEQGRGGVVKQRRVGLAGIARLVDLQLSMLGAVSSPLSTAVLPSSPLTQSRAIARHPGARVSSPP